MGHSPGSSVAGSNRASCSPPLACPGPENTEDSFGPGQAGLVATHARLGQAAQFRILTEALPARLPSSWGAGEHLVLGPKSRRPKAPSSSLPARTITKVSSLMVSLCPSGGCC